MARRDTPHKQSPARSARLAGLALLLCLSGAAMAAESEVHPRVVNMVDAGQFRAATAAVQKMLAQPDLDAAERRALGFQLERMRRIRLDFSLSADELKARIRKQIPDLTEAEFQRWDAHGLLESMVFDGQTRYFSRAAGNLFRLSAEARARRADPKPFSASPLETLNRHHVAVRDAALREHSSSVLPQRFRITQTLTVDADAVPAGKTVRAWIPWPRHIAGQQEDIKYVASEPSAHQIAPESALQRTVYLEKTAQAGQPTVFKASYEVTISARWFHVDPDKAEPATITPELKPFVSERAPHVVFTEPMRVLSRQIVGDETNPWRIAQKLYAFVDAIPWAGAREYSTISNISDYARRAGHADCGQQTLLLITLLRMNGIPARWQSGMMFSDTGYWNLHDWGQLYIAPYGWMPMDVTFGRLASDDPQLANFYLGGLDGWRIAFNDDYSRPFVPAKQHFRSETVDLQRGEAEWDGGNLYFNQWSYDFAWRLIATQEPGS